MRDLTATSLRCRDGELYILDQRRLPSETTWLRCDTPNDVVIHIRSLAIRGAPLIGIAAALMVGIMAERGATSEQLLEAIATLRSARPTAVNLMNYLDDLRNLVEDGVRGRQLSQRSEQIFRDDCALCQHIANHGAQLIREGANILTHCNTGGLATAGIGTAIGVIVTAHRQGKHIHVWVNETRPLLQGGRLTCWEMEQAGVDYHLICDSMAASLMAMGKVDMVLVGADRIAANGDVANKIGTYALAVLARFHRLPFYVVAPQTTVDPSCANGQAIVIEERHGDEVRGVHFGHSQTLWAPSQAPVHNPAFDVTPAGLISGWILDRGVFEPSEVANGALMPSYSGRA